MKENYNLYGYYVPQAPVNDEARKANGNLPVIKYFILREVWFYEKIIFIYSINDSVLFVC